MKPRLFDFNITSYITPGMIRSGYLWAVISAGACTLAVCFLAAEVWGLAAWLAAPVLFTGLVIAARIAAECFLVIFDIAEDLRRVARDRTSSAVAGPEFLGAVAALAERLDAVVANTRSAARSLAQTRPSDLTASTPAHRVATSVDDASEIVAAAEALQHKANQAKVWAEALEGEERTKALREAAEQAEVAHAAARLARDSLAEIEAAERDGRDRPPTK